MYMHNCIDFKEIFSYVTSLHLSFSKLNVSTVTEHYPSAG